MQTRSLQAFNRIDRLLPASRTSIEIMRLRIRTIQANLNRQALPMRQRFQLLEPLPFQQNAVAEYRNMHALQPIADHLHDIMQNKRLASCQEEFRQPQLYRLVDQTTDLGQFNSTSLCPYKRLRNAIPTRKIAVVVRINP